MLTCYAISFMPPIQGVEQLAYCLVCCMCHMHAITQDGAVHPAVLPLPPLLLLLLLLLLSRLLLLPLLWVTVFLFDCNARTVTL